LKSFPERSQNLAVAAVVLAAFALHGELTQWAENVEATSRLENVFFRVVSLPGGTVSMRKPPAETRADLSKLIASSPSDAELYSLRALEDEQQLDFTAAQADWFKFIDLSADKGAARLTVADYFHRRLETDHELTELAMAARENLPDAEKALPPAQQRPWRIYERAIRLVGDQRIDATRAVPLFGGWVQRYPAEAAVYKTFFEFAIDRQRYDMASNALAAYRSAFPKDQEFPIEAQAEIVSHTAPAQAVQIYERNFRPLWPPSLIAKYFDLLKRTGRLRAYLERARTAAAANPADLDAAARLFYYWQQQSNAGAADRELFEFRQRKRTAWTAQELLTMARLFELNHNYDEAARNYYALYSAAGSDGAMAETALGSLARLLLAVPEQPIHFGSANLSLYRDVGSMDPHPGFLNGVASLLLNDTDPRAKYAIEEQNAAPYFRRARGAELVALFESRFPQSPERAELRERVIEAYAIYGADDGVIRAGSKFLNDFPNAANRVAVALRMADAYARLNQTAQEFAVYDSLLAELSKRANGVPLGPLQASQKGYDGLRSPDYARVLDRYVARLVALKRVPDALALYRREIDRNPNDPGLYDTLAAFLDQNRLGAEIEQVYQRAIAQFPDHSWEHKLARWYLRQRRQADVARLTREVVQTFSGTELANYFREIVNPAAPVGPALYLELNLYAHQRFPHQLSFVRNLLNAYSAAATRNDAAYETLLRQNWYYAEDLRVRFFERLSRSGRLDAELAALRGADPRFAAEAEAWRGHFEAAAPLLLAIEKDFPADRAIGRRAAAMERSLGQIDTAVSVEENLSRANPSDAQALTTMGEMEADRDRFDRAAADWNRVAEIAPSKSDSYVRAATIFWDYYRYDGALRMIRLGRTRLGDPSLFAYEAGAIYENQRDYDMAVREYARGAIAQRGSNAQRRLLALARRPALHDQIEQLTANLASDRNPPAGAFQLRVALLRNQGRRDDLAKFLTDVARRADSPELLASIENEARADRMPDAQQAAIERQVAVTSDPVEKMRLRLSLARFFESQGKIAQGAQTADALYRDDPAILGVVRATADYHWRNKDARRAIDVLEQAAGRASAEYRAQFTLEAARKANESGEYGRAREFAQKLLATQPDQAEYLALIADSYARQGDDGALRSFYDARIRDFASRPEQAAAMRRALIPVLTRMKDFSGGLEQYIAVLNRYPDDAGLAKEAAQYASVHGLTDRLRDFYTKAASDSPKDFRWPLVLARIETQFENFPAAIAAYTRAAAVRPDRADLLEARIELEMRLLRFDEAAATAEKLYDLTYRNPKWMDQLAEIRARQGRTADTVAALRKAWLDGRAENAQNLVTIAEKLEQWGMIAEANTFAEQAWKRSPDEGLVVYARLRMRARRYNDALQAIDAANEAASPAAIQETGAVVARYYAPQEKVQFAAALEKEQQRIEIAEKSGLADVQAKWRFEELLANADAQDAAQRRQALIELETKRAAFAELGAQLEALDRAAGAKRSEDLMAAADAYRAAGDASAEFRVLQLQNSRSALQGPALDRYGALLGSRLPAAISSERRAAVADALVNYAMAHGNAVAAQRAIAARGVKNGPLWTDAYTGLAGVYFASAAAPVKTAFSDLLGNMTIGARVGKAVDRDRQLAGDLWFYYAGRYGEYARDGDFLPAALEAQPGRAQGYFDLAEYLRASGDAAGAAEEYRRALEIDPSRGDAHDRLAMIAAQAGNNDEAVREWKLAMAGDLAAMNRARVPAAFWGDVSDALHHIGAAKMFAPLRADIENLLRVYIRRNGWFEVDSLLQAAKAAGGDAAWLADLSSSAADPVMFLATVVDQPWIADADKDVLFARIVESAQARMTQSFGNEYSDAQSQLWTWRIRWAQSLLDHKQNARAAQLVADLAEARRARANEVIDLELRLAARNGRLAAQLASYENPVPMEILRSAADALRKDGDAAAAREVMEFAYDGELRGGNTDASTFLGLAEIRLQEKNTPAALALLRRMALISGEPFSALDPAARLLERTGHQTEAVEFLTELVKAEPWNMDARERLAAAQESADALAAIAKSGEAPYASRVAAARAIRQMKAVALSGTEPELMLLSRGTISEAEASQPYFFAARMEASGSRERLLRDAVAVDPNNVAAKVALFRAALAARQDSFAIGVAGALVPRYVFESEYSTWLADGFLSNLATADRVAMARGLGEAEQRRGDGRAAALFDQIAQRMEPSAATARALETVRRRMELAAANEKRRPMVTDHLDQDRLVRARLTR